MEKLEFEFTTIEKNKINFVVKNDNTIFNSYFRKEVNPIPDLVKWLENILQVNKESEFVLKTKDDEFVFNIDKRNLFVLFNKKTQEKYIEKEIHRATFIAIIYKSILEFFQSDYYLKNENKWENHKKLITEDFKGKYQSPKIELFVSYNF